MKLLRATTSLCNLCYKEIPATVEIREDGVFLHKACSVHGVVQDAMLERDPIFYTYVMALNSKTIYEGYFVDVTRMCNLRCTWCYYHLEKTDPEGPYSIQAIVDECRVNAHRAPFILTGGEPTLREDLPELIREVSKLGEVEMITNGVKLSDPKLLRQIAPLLTHRAGASMIHLSIHPQTDKWRQVIAWCRSDGIKIGSILAVVDSEESFNRAVEMAIEFADVCVGFRIKAASRIWNEQKPGSGADKVFVSDMLGWLEKSGREYTILTHMANKSVFLNIVVEGVFIMLVSWHDTANVDLQDIECAPWYRARNGEVRNMVTSMLKNEGWDSGWVNGARVAENGNVLVKPGHIEMEAAEP